jgi:hypothetical protein
VYGDQHPQKVALRAQRERVLERLSEGFARDEIGLDDFERRVDGAYGATSIEALAPLIVDLEPALASSLKAPLGVPTDMTASSAAVRTMTAPVRAVEPAASALVVPARRAERSLALFGNIERAGRYHVQDGSRILAVFGNVELDLRNAVFAPGVTTLWVRAVFGNIELTVPPDLAVECVGAGIFGSFASMNRVPADDTAPALLRVVGDAVFGNVEVHTRPRGDARARHLLGR